MLVALVLRIRAAAAALLSASINARNFVTSFGTSDCVNNDNTVEVVVVIDVPSAVDVMAG